MASPSISVILPAHNAAEVIPFQLGALASQDHDGPWEVIVVDDASTDGTADVAQRWSGALDLKVHRLVEKATGVAAVRNAGVTIAAGDRLLFCDADDVVGDGWLAAMAAALEDHDFVACRVDMDRLNSSWVVASRHAPQASGLQMYGNPPFLPHAGGGTLGLTRELLDDVGSFDTSPEMAAQEAAEFCLRTQLAGHRLEFVPDAVVHVRMRSDLRGMYRQARAWGRCSVTVDLRFADDGLQPTSSLRAALGWPGLLVRLAQVRHRGDLAQWVHRLGWKVGRIRGSIDARRVML